MRSAIITRTPTFLASPAAAAHYGRRRRPAAKLDLQGFDLKARVSEPEVELAGGGVGDAGAPAAGGAAGDPYERLRTGEQYRQMIRMDPSNPLLLMNYGKFLHEVEGDAKGAEEYYGRAILVGPGDGEALSLYGKLVWESEKDEERAGSYFERAVEASPNDCYVLGSYAHFLWDSEEVEDEGNVSTAPPLADTF